MVQFVDITNIRTLARRAPLLFSPISTPLANHIPFQYVRGRSCFLRLVIMGTHFSAVRDSMQRILDTLKIDFLISHVHVRTLEQIDNDKVV